MYCDLPRVVPSSTAVVRCRRAIAALQHAAPSQAAAAPSLAQHMPGYPDDTQPSVGLWRSCGRLSGWCSIYPTAAASRVLILAFLCGPAVQSNYTLAQPTDAALLHSP